ncbi:hypothetical protein HWV62_17734 [Athelia sp. TMB]|nr:hypothetical protein HWV62_17734 [Athelia sp. TMB]
MHRISCLPLLLLPTAFADPNVLSLAPLVDLGYARYRGSTDPHSNITTFLGIRFAAPPTGSLRFQAPQNPTEVNAIQDATEFPPQCYQSLMGLSPTNSLLPVHKRAIEPTHTSEDCLFLDVVVPHIRTAYELPVVASMDAWWRAHGGRTHPPLFRAAMTSSAIAISQYPADDLLPTAYYYRLANLTGCLAPSAMNLSSFDCLVALDSDVLGLANALIITSGFFGTVAFGPVVDGEFIIERPMLTLGRGRVNGDILLAVTNTFEGHNFVPPDLNLTTMSLSHYARELFPLMSAMQMERVETIYKELGGSLQDQAISVVGESIFICPSYHLLRAFEGRSWKGEFAIPPGYHGDDIPYYFTSGGQPFPSPAFISSFSGSFLDVILSLNPNIHFDLANKTPHWPHWSVDHEEMLFNKTESGEPLIRVVKTDDGLLERCKFWESVSAQTAQ